MKSMFISVAMLLSLSVPALADDDKNKGDNGGVRSGTGQVEIAIEADDELRKHSGFCRQQKDFWPPGQKY